MPSVGGGRRPGQRRCDAIHEAVAAGTVFLTICGTYRLFGRRFLTQDGQEIPGIGVFAMDTIGGRRRMIGNVVAATPWGDLVGFENHSADPAGPRPGGPGPGRGLRQQQNRREAGAVTANCFGTYLHGSLLPKNPAFADELLLRALRGRHGAGSNSRPSTTPWSGRPPRRRPAARRRPGRPGQRSSGATSSARRWSTSTWRPTAGRGSRSGRRTPPAPGLLLEGEEPAAMCWAAPPG